ncbi:carbohydrate ABC transporter permease [Alicyclobacillus curvatus]|jgi:ABC-type glycerol-3-phosphate transport system permease component|nr:carbohydrate ABC transporter permease [Alicyclobacillus curvatus]
MRTSSLRAEHRFWNTLRRILIVIFLIFILLPIGYVILISLTPDTQVGDGSLWPTHLAWGNYVKMWQTIHLARDIRNSVIISGFAGVIATLIALGAAYVLARFKFRGRRVFLLSLITMQTVPQVMLLLPLFVIFVIIQRTIAVQMVGQYYTVVLTYMTFALPFACWLLLSYMANIPLELEEAAAVDGCARLGIVRHIVFPLILPGLVVAFVFSFLLGWSDVLFASVLTNGGTQTVAVGLQAYVASGQAGGDVFWGQLMAASLTSGIPIIIIFLFVQKYIIGGLAAGSVKG